MKSLLNKWLLLIVPCVAASSFYGWFYLEAGKAATTPNEYVDSRACATCHTKIAQTYRLTGMARSFYQPTPANGVEDLSKGNPFFQQASETWYKMLKHDGKLYQRRWRIGFDGKPSEVQELPVDYVMGSGNHARAYLSRTERGTLIELPLAWYAEGGGKWAMNPGYDRDYELPTRTVAYECMFCHNSYPKIPAGHEEPGSEYAYAGALPEGIDCQRCHGPGGDHLRAAKQAGASAQAIRSAIVNPARLSPDRQLEVCMQCHLETASMGLPHSIQRYGRSPFSYKPGEPLSEFAIFFDRADHSGHEDDFEIAHSAYRLRKSRCFLKSKGALTCTTCHDPHDVPRGRQAELHYNSACQQCHATKLRPLIAAGAHTSAATCTACHMPKRRTMDVVNAVMTDHLISRRPPAGDPLAPITERHEENHSGEIVPYYPNPLAATGEDALYAAVAQTIQGNNLRIGIPRLAAEIGRQRPARPEFYLELGQASLAAGNKTGAIQMFEEALRREPKSPAALLDVGDALTQAGEVQQAIDVLQRAVETIPDEPLLWYQLGLAHSAARHSEEAIAALDHAVSLDANLADAYSELGAVLAASGDLPRAETALRAALRIQPDMQEALSVLSELLAAKHDLPQAVYYSRRAVKADRNSPDAHNSLGTLLEQTGEHAIALREFDEAIRLRPEFGLAHLNAAEVLTAQGNRAAARAHLERAAKDADAQVRERARAALR